MWPLDHTHKKLLCGRGSGSRMARLWSLLCAGLCQDPVPVESDDDDAEEDMDVLPRVPKITSFKEAIQNIEDVQIFSEDKGLLEQASSASSLVNQMASFYSSSLSQATLDHYILAN